MHGIRFDPPCIVFPNTYISSTNRITIKALNESDKVHHISFRNKETIQEEIDILNQQDFLNPEQRSNADTLFDYSSDIFTIEPHELDIWPHSFQQIVFTFRPISPTRSTSIAYVQIDEYEERYKMQIVAAGLSPAAQFLTSQIIVGNVFLDSIFEYQVILKNVGEVPVHFCYEPHDTGNLLFEFTPSEGEISVNNQVPIIVRFTASAVKSFNETFIFKIKGSNINHPSLIIHGKVIGPTFSINPKQINFGGVGYGFLYSKTIEIENNSEIPFDFTLRMSHDGSFERREFQLKPEFGTINKFSKQEVTIEFIPISIQSYSLSLLLDITRYGTNLAEIPIIAKCFCPKLELIPPSVNFKEAFIGYKYNHNVVIKNDSPYPAKFEVVPQDSESRKKGIIESDKSTGLIAPNSDTSVDLSFTTQSIGSISAACFFRVFGSDDPPLKFTFNANSMGPKISLSTNNIDFGTIPVLVAKTQELILTNNSLIDANFKCHIESSTGGFSVSPESETIAAHSSLPISIIVLVNDLLSFTGTLKLCFDYLDPISIPLKSQGSGSPIISSIDMKCIDFGYVLTEQPAVKKFVMENKSNRSFEIRFTPNKVQTPKNQKSDFVFTIDPEHVIIKGQSTQSFVINLHCTTVVPFVMPLQCHATIGRQRILLFDSVLKGSFVKPLVSFSSTLLEFKLQCLPSGEPRSQMSPNKELLTTITQPLSITNKSKLMLPIEVDCPEPFSVNLNNINIEPEETKELIVSFNPSFKNNFVTEEIQRIILFSLVDHPQKINVNAKGLIIFPNLKFAGDCIEMIESDDDNKNNIQQQIDFGVLMMNTETTKSIEMTNNTDIIVEYEWQLISSDANTNKVFDIFPLYGIIEPNKSIQAHFSFYALADLDGNVCNFKANAVCHVTGGPDYVISLTGSSATILYKVSPVSFSYSSICFSSKITDSMTITNSSKAAISFTIKIPRNSTFQSFTVLPKTGIISPNDSASLSLSIIPGIPKLFKESFFIQIGDFEEVKVDIELEACFSQVLISLPRSKNDASTISLKEKVDLKLTNKASQVLPEIIDESTSKSNIDILRSQKQLQQFQQQQKELYNFTEEQLLEEEKNVILTQMTTNEETDSISKSNTPSYVASYEIQFGEMIISEPIKKTFTIKSVAPFPITFEMDVNKLKKTGIKIEPSMVKDLMPGNEVEIDVSFTPINRKLSETGLLCYNIPFIFSDNHYILLSIVAKMNRPSLNFSSTNFDFDHVIIGQTKVMTIQLQNMSSAACEFKIGPFEQLDQPNQKAVKSSSRRINDIKSIGNKMNSQKAGKNQNKEQNLDQQNIDQSPFTTIPDSGILPPSSFMNISINFSPFSDKTTTMKFPINISYNKEPFYITVSGTGDAMRLIFEPKELLLPSIQPYSQSSTAEVVVKNPNPYSIEFFSLQFDQQLITEEAADPRQAESPFVTYTPKAKNSSSASKFAICLIINGPPYSGKTTIAKELSSFLNLPIINLKEIWSETTDYLSKLYTALMANEYNKGFIVDGLDCLDDNGENENFLQSVFKMNKNASEEIAKNPFTAFNHQGQSLYERVFEIILGSLNGHFVFHIAIKLPIDDTITRKNVKNQQEEKLKLKSLEEEKEKLFSMSEEEYLNLNEDERLDVDNKRRYYRNEIISSIEKIMEGQRLIAEGHEKKKKNDEIKSSSRANINQNKKKLKPNQVPNDPTQAMSVAFQYSLGIIAQKAQNATDRFKAIDPYEIRPKVEEIDTNLENEENQNEESQKEESIKEETKTEENKKEEDKKEDSKKEEDKKEENKKEESKKDEKKKEESKKEEKKKEESKKKDSKKEENKKKENKKDENKKEESIKEESKKEENKIEENKKEENEQEESVTNSYEHLMNTILVDGTKSVDEIMNDILDYLPPVTTLKEVAFKMQIPDPYIKDDSTNDSLKMVNKIPQFFSIVRDEIPQPTKVSSTKKGSNKEQATSKSDHSLDIIDEAIAKNLTGRWKLPPDGETSLTIRFESTTVGNITDSLLFSIAKCEMQPAKLKVKGLCQYPEIERDYKLIFDKLIKKLEPKNCPAFVVSQSEFDFGFCITCKDKPAKGQMQYKTVVKITNVSQFVAECQAAFVSQTGNNKGAWIIEQPNFSIQPANSFELTVGFHPVSSELFKTKLGIFIKDNPEPLFIDFSGDSSVPVIETSQQNVDFEKVLIGNEKSKKIELKNTGKIPAYWKLKGAQQFSPNITFSVAEGELIPSKTSRIIAKFSSQKPVQIKKQLTIEVYDIEKSRLFSSFNVNLSAESFDVNFDVMFPKGQQDQFDFGQIKVGQSKVISINLRNRGKYPVDYKFSFTNKDVSKYLKLSSKEGSVKNGDKLVPINLTFCSNSVVKFDSTKCLTLSIIDTQTKSTTAQLSYTITASTFYSMFTIDCDKTIQFGNVQSNVNYHKEIVITNTGPFPFEYDFQGKSNPEENINNNADDVSDSGSVSSSHATKKQQNLSKQKKKGTQQNSIQVSAYLVYPATGTINPGASITVSVDLNSSEAGKFDAMMIMNISESNPNNKPTIFKLLSDVFIPGINVNDKERLFPRLPLCVRFDMSKSDLTSFLEDENVLHFAPLVAGQKQTVNVRLLNQQPIPIDVDLSTKSKGKSLPFELSEKSVQINGNDFANIVITFAPTSSENYQATFEANVRNGTNPSTKTLKFGIEGIGTVPSICLKTQLDKSKGNGSYCVTVGRTNIGYKKQKVIAIGNESAVPCTVLFQITTKNIIEDFSIEGCENDKTFILESGHQFNFTVIHKPQKVRKAQVDVAVSCVENPKSNMNFTFLAEGFSEDVIFEGLEGEDNELHFRGAVIGRPQSASFTLRNLSDATIRFMWTAPSNEFVFAPRVGHIKPHQSKEITVTFSSEKSMKIAGAKSVCQITKIELIENKENNANDDDWDDTQKMLTFVPRSEILASSQPENSSRNQNQQQQQQSNNNNKNNSKNKKGANNNDNTNVVESDEKENDEQQITDLISVAAVKPEPMYNLVSSGRPKEMSIKIFAISDAIKLSLDSTEIPFAATMMFQTRTSEFKMTNSSQIRIEYEWINEKFESLRTDYASTRPCPFTIEPSSGFIEPGSQKTFKAIFAPMEVDDFTALFKCHIPYYSSESPQIFLTALSRRPICHFDVPLSDYLNRRHPEFTDQLPEGVKVIEVFAKSIKSRSSAKVEVINPTSKLYETKWTLVKDNADGSIACDNVSAIISSGKRYLFPFSYCPKSAKTVECLFLFEIPAHEIKVYFLIVGRITH